MTRDIEKGSPGQFFDDYLKEEGTYEATTEQAVKRVLAFQVAEAMKQQGVSKPTPAFATIPGNSVRGRLPAASGTGR